MSDIVLSKGIRNNLLQLQNTADKVALTQGRLSTGKKVNSALDNPTNFFTAASLTSRAKDLTNLLDGLSSGIKVLEAADNGLKAITRTIESLQSTVRQARQDKTFKSQTYSLDTTTIGTSALKNISFSGGAVGSTAVNVALNTTAAAAVQNTIVGSAAYTAPTAAVQSTVAGSAAYQAPTAAVAATSGGVTAPGAFASFSLGASDTLKFDVSVDGTTQNLTFTQAEVITALGGGGGTIATVDELATVINSKLTGATASNSSGDLALTSSSTGTSSNVSVIGVNINDGTTDTPTNSTGFDGTTGATGTAGTAAVAAVDRVITISDGTNTANITLTAANAGDAATAASYINAQLTSAGITGTATNSSGTLSLAGAADGSNSLTIGGAGASAVFGAGATTTAGTAAVDRVISISDGTNTANITLTSANAGNAATAASYINSQLTSAGITGTVTNNAGTLTLSGAVAGTNNLTLSGAGATAVFGASPTTTAGTAATGGSVKTVDELVAAINSNTSLTDKVRASADNGKLRIENLSTDALDISGIASGAVTGTGTTTTDAIGPNDVRKNLVTQFNDLRNQLDKFSDDASFNGINLLKGDKLKLFLNENSTSTIEVQAKDTAGNVREISNTKLGIDAATNAEFEDDTALDGRLDGLKTALDTIRSQSSSFGSNLSIVQNRQDFTKSTINTLQTGADNLTLADMNEEAANLLSLQTRQQLSQTALSLANQADQGVLRLFG
ncbi:flagellin [Prosthecomicrobium hirschii]|uniref:flagellin N-terminal helical domain-containing protein n=1 Tax=Prosthecodimorpha hirschii TaxID=665126 RepID=UPI002220D717|nr:flagellin [Prosthecomicrobium hirschii]MCW1843962.1 flagellin [Prosthecomicrobium hirschii]